MDYSSIIINCLVGIAMGQMLIFAYRKTEDDRMRQVNTVRAIVVINLFFLLFDIIPPDYSQIVARLGMLAGVVFAPNIRTALISAVRMFIRKPDEDRSAPS